MADIDVFFEMYEKKNIFYRGRCDDIKSIIVNMCDRFKNINTINYLVRYYTDFRFINSIDVDGNSFFIRYDEGSISFWVMDDDFFSRFCNNIFVNDKLYRECHFATLKFLMNFCCERYRAVTSLCVSVSNSLFFHSYIYDVHTNLVYDFSRNIIMDKVDFDKLFCYDEINCLSYSDYIVLINNSDYSSQGFNYYQLLYLALKTLEDRQKNDVLDKRLTFKK